MNHVKNIGLSTVQWQDPFPMPVPVGCERRIALTEADVARIDEVCANQPAITEHMRAALDRYRGKP